MKKYTFIIITLFSLLLASCSQQVVVVPAESSNAATISLDGKWQFLPITVANHTDKQKPDWKTIQVPANWYQQGFDIYGQADYKKQFFVDKTLKNKRVTVVFHGVDYHTTVWLNGQQLGTHEGYFQRFAFDATPALKLGKLNELRVRVDSPLEKEADFSLRKRLIKGIFSHHDTRPGGAWSKRGQEQNTGGIWDSVQLHISEQVFAQGLKAIPKQVNSEQWQLMTTLDMQGDLPQDTEFHWQLTAKNHTGQPLSGVSKKPTFVIHAQRPQLWWPIGFGEPHLYDLTVAIKHQDKTLDQIQTTTAFRKIELTKDKVWKINDQRILLRGTNYIATQWLSEMSRDKFARDIQLMKDAHINAVRVHAHITAPEFYALCDEQGLMVWQDFPLQWGYQDTEVFHQQAELQLADMINQLANHPSIVHWTLHNEPPWDADWMKWKYPDYQPSQNKALDEKLYALATRLETSRPVSKHSATKEHPWLGWYSGHWLDYAKPTDQAFISEFGAQALPHKAHLKRILQGDIKRPPVSEAEKKNEWKSWKKWQYHNFQPKETFEIAKVKAGNNTDDLIKNTQAYQAQIIQLAAESYRRQAYRPVTALFQFMFVEDWPSMNWGIVDYWRDTKAGYQQLQMAYQPILPSIEWSKIEYPEGAVILGLWLLNDTPRAYQNIRYDIELYKNNKRMARHRLTMDMNADMHKKLQDYQTPVLRNGAYYLLAKVSDQQGKVLGHNRYDFTVK